MKITKYVIGSTCVLVSFVGFYSIKHFLWVRDTSVFSFRFLSGLMVSTFLLYYAIVYRFRKARAYVQLKEKEVNPSSVLTVATIMVVALSFLHCSAGQQFYGSLAVIAVLFFVYFDYLTSTELTNGWFSFLNKDEDKK